jgi:threonyl-tRNA synthetase
MLQRIYGTAFFTQAELDQYLNLSKRPASVTIAAWEKSSTSSCSTRSRRGRPFWTERGTIIFNVLNATMRTLQVADYREIKTPLIYNRQLWEISGHWGSTERTCSSFSTTKAVSTSSG